MTDKIIVDIGANLKDLIIRYFDMYQNTTVTPKELTRGIERAFKIDMRKILNQGTKEQKEDVK